MAINLTAGGAQDEDLRHVVARFVAARRPGIVETLKLAAVQYIAFFLPIGYLLSCLHSALFRFGVVSARVHHPVKEHKW